MKTPVVLIAGFLGSGKTTLVRHIVANTDRRVAVIVNEFGDLGVDTQTIAGEHIAVREILEGCVCCSLQGELDAAFAEIIDKYHPDTILVETTGVAEPDNVVLTIQQNSELVRLDCMVAIVDAPSIGAFPQLTGTVREQVRHADVVLVNKVDIAQESLVRQMEAEVRRCNTSAQVLRTVRCNVDVDVLLSVEVEHRVVKVHDHTTDMNAVTIAIADCSRDELEKAVAALPPAVFRVKGRVRVDGVPMLVDVVAGRRYIEPVTAADNKLVCIGRNITVDDVSAFRR